jgi:organic hydroperoxide reductase OsmC/OhrA
VNDGNAGHGVGREKIRTFQDRYQATVTGDIEDVDGILKITRIDVNYTLRVPEEKQEAAREAFEAYLPHCPAAQSVIGCIDINHDLMLSFE